MPSPINVNVGSIRSPLQDVNQSVGMLQRAISDVDSRAARNRKELADTMPRQRKLAEEQTIRKVLQDTDRNPELLASVNNEAQYINKQREDAVANLGGTNSYYAPDGTIKQSNRDILDPDMMSPQEKRLYDIDQEIDRKAQGIAGHVDENGQILDTVTNPVLYGQRVNDALVNAGVNTDTASKEYDRIQKQYAKPKMTEAQKIAMKAEYDSLNTGEKAYLDAVNYLGEDHRKVVYNPNSKSGGYNKKGKYTGNSAQRGHDIGLAMDSINKVTSWTNLGGATGEMDSNEAIALMKQYTLEHPEISPQEAAEVITGSVTDGVILDGVDKPGAIKRLDNYLNKRRKSNKSGGVTILGDRGNSMKQTAALIDMGQKVYANKRAAITAKFGSSAKTPAQLLPNYFSRDLKDDVAPATGSDVPAETTDAPKGSGGTSSIYDVKAKGILGEYNRAMRSPAGNGAVLKLVNDKPNEMAQLLSGKRSKKEINDFMSVYKGTPEEFNAAFGQLAGEVEAAGGESVSPEGSTVTVGGVTSGEYGANDSLPQDNINRNNLVLQDPNLSGFDRARVQGNNLANMTGREIGNGTRNLLTGISNAGTATQNFFSPQDQQQPYVDDFRAGENYQNYVQPAIDGAGDVATGFMNDTLVTPENDEFSRANLLQGQQERQQKKQLLSQPVQGPITRRENRKQENRTRQNEAFASDHQSKLLEDPFSRDSLQLLQDGKAVSNNPVKGPNTRRKSRAIRNITKQVDELVATGVMGNTIAEIVDYIRENTNISEQEAAIIAEQIIK